ncbi:ABC transporter substrate-binding protein [Treponema primitia]|uniref:ABC transporter substrate-binding protein n=1 Tax=Treponema primitia TaxID=88058 RepID=UPI000255500A|nr:ABC transporter substrate-binding protein [Treponema primitia]
MKKESIIELVPDSMRENLDYLGHVHCPIKDRFSTAWKDFETEYNRSRDPKLKGVVPMGGCGVDIYYNISAIQDMTKFPAVVSESGYGEYFTGNFLESPEKQEYFVQWPLPQPVHPLFRNLDLRDPRENFSIFGAMPYVLLVNHRRLNGRPAPRSVSDLTNPIYEGSVGTGFAPEDITELLLLEIWKEQGEEGIRSLARNIGFAGRAPEMAADSLGNRDGCCVYFISWFFAHAVPKRDFLEIIWPEDGAVLNPMYALIKKDLTEPQRAAAEWLFSPKLGQIMADGWFAHVNSAVRYPLPGDAKIRWVGWDYIYEKGLLPRVEEIEAIYYDERRKNCLSVAAS